METLLSCPWCGKTPHIIQTKCMTNGITLYHIYHNEIGCPLDSIRTKNCDTVDEAINMWNTRYKE